jgi:hypothetical protein
LQGEAEIRLPLHFAAQIEEAELSFSPALRMRADGASLLHSGCPWGLSNSRGHRSRYDRILQKQALLCANLDYSIDKIAPFAIQWEPITKTPRRESSLLSAMSPAASRLIFPASPKAGSQS